MINDNDLRLLKPLTLMNCFDLWRLAFEGVRARIRRQFRLMLTANDRPLVLTLSANELAIDGAGSHSMAAGSRQLQMKFLSKLTDGYGPEADTDD